MENINNTEFKELISENSGAVIIDCRTESEWDEGRIKNAVLLDLFESQLFMQESEKVLIKAKCIWSIAEVAQGVWQLVRYLESVGIKNVYNLTGGITSWDGDIII